MAEVRGALNEGSPVITDDIHTTNTMDQLHI